jgi:acyl carrier protein
MEETILQFVRDHFKASIGTAAIGPETPLFTTGIVDSFGVLELIAFLEDEFGVAIDPAQHELVDFDTARKITALLQTLPKSS